MIREQFPEGWTAPSDWTVVPLSEAVEQIDYGLSAPIPKTVPENGFPIVSTADISKSGRILYEKIRRTSAPEKTASRLTLREGDLLFNWRNSAELIGKTGVFTEQSEPHIFASFILRIRCDETKIHNLFLAYLMNYYREARIFVNLARRAVNQANYNRNEISVLKIPRPPYDEQRKIAAVLGLVQRAIEQQEQLIALAVELKKALLHKLFTEGLRGEPQKQTEIGAVPEGWEETTLGKLAAKPHGFLQTGPFGSQLHKHEYLSEGVGVVNPTHLWGNRINHEDIPRVSKETVARLERHCLEAGDILFARRGQIGRHGLVTKTEEGWLCGTGCFLARVHHEHIDNRFLSYLFSTPGVIAWLNSHSAGAIMPNLNNTVLRSMPVFYPMFDVQVEIADCLDACEQKMINHVRKKESLSDLFRTLLHQLMTAQIRVRNRDMMDLEALFKE